MMVTGAIVLGFILDLLFGDPHIPHFPHPVVLMGRLIEWLEARLRAAFPATETGLKRAGVVLTAVTVGLTLAITGVVCWGAATINPWLGFAIQTLWCWQALALTDLKREAEGVYRALTGGTLPEARRAVARIVGRDTQKLDEAGVIRATVETEAENFSDGVVAPLVYLCIGGAPLGMAYKAVNTLDSMVGYKNDRYLNLGRASAKLDDVVNFVPSRFAALIWVAACPLVGQNAKDAWNVWRSDSRNHTSPNSAQCEAACAGGLGIQLGGPNRYFGTVVDKPFIGVARRAPEPADIRRTSQLLSVAGVEALIICVLIRACVIGALL